MRSELIKKFIITDFLQKLLLNGVIERSVLRCQMKNNVKKAVIGGFGLGFINGLFGGGGGMIAVPMLKGLLNYPQKQAHATAILVILPVCTVSAITYILNGFVNMQILIPATIGNVVGGLLGGALLGKLPRFWVNLTFVAVMLVAGVRMVVG